LGQRESAKPGVQRHRRANRALGVLDHRGLSALLDARRLLYQVALQGLRDVACRRGRFFLP
jgi:hypothetical protein